MHRLERELRGRPELLDFLDQGGTDGLWYWDIETNEEWYSPRLCEVLGYRQSEVPCTPEWWQSHIFPEDKEAAIENATLHMANPAYPYDQIVRYRHKNGQTIWVRCRGRALFENGVATRMIGAHNDITALMTTKEQLERETRHDPLTGVLNRRGIEEALTATIQQVRRLRCEAYAILIDIDDFKAVNDAIGHAGGDLVLQEAARCIQDSVRVVDLVGRHGGDEFIVYLLARNRTEAQHVADRVHENLRECAIAFDGADIEITLSSALIPVHSEDGPSIDRLDTLLRAGAPYLKRSKSNGKNQISVQSVMPPSSSRS